MMRSKWYLGVGLLLIGGGCGADFNPLNYPGPQALMEASEQKFRQGKFGDAALGFRRLTISLPARDSVAVRARFLLAETSFGTGDYLEAARQFRRVANENPTHPLAPRAMLRAGDSQFRLWRNPQLDPTYGEAATQTYRELLARFPGTPAARRGTLKLRELALMFAEKDFRTAEFYFKTWKAYESAILYYKSVVAQYAESPYASASLLRLIEIYETLGYDEERTEMCDHLQQFYPDTQVDADRCAAATGTP